MGALQDLYRRYGSQVAFLVIYIKEAHPADGWVMESNVADEIHVLDPITDAERVEVAQTCAVRLDIEMPVLVDGIDNRVASLYGGLPDRLYLIGRDGRVRYQGERGPQGFKPEELEASIRGELART